MMNTKSFGLITISLLAFATICPGQNDLRIKQTSRINMPGMPGPMKNPQTGEMVDPSKMPDINVFFKGQRMMTEVRQEMNTGMGVKKNIYTRIRQCDLRREISFSNKSKNYYVSQLQSGGVQGRQPVVKTVPTAERHGSVTYSISYTDTGERLPMFGRTARHVKTVISTKPSPDACEKKPFKMETDAWYIDLPAFSCPTFSPPPRRPGKDDDRGCNDETIFEVNGKADNGFAVKETQTISSEGMEFSIIKDTVDISMSELDGALFDVPPGYKEGKESIRDSSDSDTTADSGDVSYPSDPGVTAPLAPIPVSSTPTGDTPLPAKKQGVIRIGIAKPEIKMPETKDDYSAPMQVSSAVRDTLVESLEADNVEAVRLSSDNPISEAKEKQCDYIFYATVTQKRGGGGMFGKMIAMGALSAVGGFIPGVGGMVASTVASIAMQQTMGKATKAKDEFTLDYKVLDLNNAPLNQGTSKAKAKQDGEDVLTPQLKQASATVMAEVAKKK